MAWPPGATNEAITGGVVTVVGVVYYAATFSIQETNNIVTPRTFPAIVGIALILLGIAVVIEGYVRARRSAASVAAGGSVAEVAAGSSTGAGATSAGETDSGATSAEELDEGGTSAEDGAGAVIEAQEEPRTKPLLLQFAIFFVYLAILIPVGFLLSTAAFLMTLTSIYAPKRWVRNLLYSVLFSVIVYIAFVYGLKVYLPVGILG